MRTLVNLLLFFTLVLPSSALSAENGMNVKSVRYFSYPAFTRIVFELQSAAPYVLNKTSDNRGLLFTAYNMPMAVAAPLPTVRDGVVNGLELTQDAGRAVVLVRLDNAAADVKDFVLRSPDRIVLDIGRRNGAASPERKADGVTIVLDPGHGSSDTGVYSLYGPEKTFTLDVALSIKKILQKNTGLKVVLTREKDQALSWEERAAIANASRPLVFVTLHGGVGAVSRVFFEDAVDDSGTQPRRSTSGDFLGFEAGSEQQAMAWGKQQGAHLRQSADLAHRLARQLTIIEKNPSAALPAPLAGVNAVDSAAVVVEVGMATDRQKAAETIAEGIEQYVRQVR